MAKLVKLESDADVSKYTPDEGRVTTFFKQDGSSVKLAYKNSAGDVIEFQQHGEGYVDQPAPQLGIEVTTGVVTASSTAPGGMTRRGDTAYAQLQLPVDPGLVTDPMLGTIPEIALSKEGTTIEGGTYLTNDVRIPGVELLEDKLVKGYNVYGYEGTHVCGATEPVVPDHCEVFLHGKYLYVRRTGSVVTYLNVVGLPEVGDVSFGGATWTKYGPFAEEGIFGSGSVKSQDGVYLEWDGFSSDLYQWTVHSLINGRQTASNTYALGFEEPEMTWEDNYEISGLQVWWYCNGGSGVGFPVGSPFRYHEGAPGAAWFPAAFTWDGPNGKAYGLDQASNATHTTLYPYDEEMGMPGSKQVPGSRLYLGKPANRDGVSGATIGGFALEVIRPNVSTETLKYTSAVDYISPLLDGTYKNL